MTLKEFYEDEEIFGHEWQGNRDRINKILKYVKKIKAKKVLDIGCGDGFLGNKIKRSVNCEIYGTDISESALKQARSKGLKTKQTNSEKLPFKDNTFDLVVAGEIIEHLVDPDLFLQEINRVLKPNKYLILTTPNLAAWYNRGLLLIGIQPYFTEVSTKDKRIGREILYSKNTKDIKPSGHLRLFTYKSIINLISMYNFKIIKTEGYNFPMGALGKLDIMLSKFPRIASGFVIVAKKTYRKSTISECSEIFDF